MTEKIIEILKQCYDPELPVDLWSLGLIYEINAKELANKKNEVGIIMTLTTPGCMMGDHMANDIKQKLETLNEIATANDFDPQALMNACFSEAKMELAKDIAFIQGNLAALKKEVGE